MPAGTITLTNNSTAVTGSGTAFPTEIKANDFLVAVVGGTTYTLGVKSVESATALTLTTAYGGPTTGGLAWTPIPNGTLVGITAQIAADTARAIRGLNYDKQNWQQVYSASGNITVTLPDGSSYTGPSWNKLTGSLSEKADKSSFTFGDTTGTYCQGNDARLSTINGKSGGSVNGNITATLKPTITEGTVGPILNARLLWGNGTEAASSAVFTVMDAAGGVMGHLQFAKSGAGKDWLFDPVNGNATSQGSWVPNSDGRLKDKIARIENPLDKMKLLKGCTWMRLDTGMWGIGFIAQDVAQAFPDAVHAGEDRELSDGSTVEKVLSPDTYGVAAALHHEAILALMDDIEALKAAFQKMNDTPENLHNA